MKKRTFIKHSAIAIAGMSAMPMVGCKMDKTRDSVESNTEEVTVRASFTLPALSYALDALAPNIDAQTMEIHHGKHHAGYVKKLNSALADSSIKGNTIEEILANVSDADTGVRNNGGGHYNHSLYWSTMSPSGGGAPTGDLANAINAAFGKFDNFKEQFSTAAKTRFGSGWAWLCQDKEGKLFVSSTPNQDNPLMRQLVDLNGTPLLGIDVWEHAYYLHYQNRRGDYISNFFNVIDWNVVAQRLV